MTFFFVSFIQKLTTLASICNLPVTTQESQLRPWQSSNNENRKRCHFPETKQEERFPPEAISGQRDENPTTKSLRIKARRALLLYLSMQIPCPLIFKSHEQVRKICFRVIFI